MKMEYRMVLRFLKAPDFYEGVRALIVDKDQQPKWQPNDLKAISKQEVDAYFQPLKNSPELVYNGE